MRFLPTLLFLVTTMLCGLSGTTTTVLAHDDGTTDVSCVQVSSGTNLINTCPCGLANLSFSIVGETSMTNNTVNLAVVLDGSGTISTINFLEAKDFAKDIAAAFAARNLFANGGTASYVQFSSDVDPSDTGTFFSLSDFNDFVDSNDQIFAGTDIDAGIIAAQDLLNAAPPASAAFMVVLTDGEDNVGEGNVAVTADNARADGITLLAVGVGFGVSTATLLDIGGTEDNVFSVAAFQDLGDVVNEILESDDISTIPCPATSVTLFVEYGPTVVSSTVSGATISGATVTFTVDDLEDNPTEIEVELDTCGVPEPVVPIVSIMYTDDEGNIPDFNMVLDMANGSTCPPATSPPTTSPAIYPTLVIPYTCSNGVVGVEGGGQCCVLECDKCKDNDCRKRARNATLTKDDCCPDRISDSGVYCEDVGTAPCILDKPLKHKRRKDKKGHN